jgi:hypothetical protein
VFLPKTIYFSYPPSTYPPPVPAWRAHSVFRVSDGPEKIPSLASSRSWPPRVGVVRIPAPPAESRGEGMAPWPCPRAGARTHRIRRARARRAKGRRGPRRPARPLLPRWRRAGPHAGQMQARRFHHAACWPWIHAGLTTLPFVCK